jgi:hypothetical protein
MSYWIAGSMVVSAGVSLYGVISGNAAADDANAVALQNQQLTNDIAEKNLAFQKEEARKLEIQKEKYRRMDFKNPYANITNPFAGITSEYENVYEDLTVNQQQAQFEAEQGAQVRADTLQSLRGAAGGSGIASLAQVMANQGQLQTQKISASIGQQEAMNQRLQAQGAGVAQQMESQAERTIAQGASAAQMARLGGEQMLQTMEMDRQATLLGIQMGQSAGANAALQQAYSNQLSSGAAMASLYGTQAAGMYGMAGQALGATISLAGAMSNKGKD